MCAMAQNTTECQEYQEAPNFRELRKAEVQLSRTPVLDTSVNSAAKAYSSCPDSRMAALFIFLSFRAGSGCNHSEACAGCIVSFTTPTRSSLNASRSVSSRNWAEKVSMVFTASYFLR